MNWNHDLSHIPSSGCDGSKTKLGFELLFQISLHIGSHTLLECDANEKKAKEIYVSAIGDLIYFATWMWKSLLPACRGRKRSNCAFFLLNKIRNERSKVSRKSFSIWNFSSPSVDVYKATLTISIWYATGIARQSIESRKTPTGFRGSQTLSTPELPLLKFLTREKCSTHNRAQK